MTLTDPTDAELDAAFALHVANWQLWPKVYHNHQWLELPTWVPPVAIETPGHLPTGCWLSAPCPRFTHSTDMMLGWLSKPPHQLLTAYPSTKGWHIEVGSPDSPHTAQADDYSFARAAVIALLRLSHSITFTSPP